MVSGGSVTGSCLAWAAVPAYSRPNDPARVPSPGAALRSLRPARRPRLFVVAALAVAGLLALAGCAGTADTPTTTDGPGESASETVQHEADLLPLGTEPWKVVSLTREGEPVDTGSWQWAEISPRRPFILAVPEFCTRPQFGITEVSETAWQATPDVAQPAAGCAPDHDDGAAMGALAALFDGTVQVTPPSGADLEMRLNRADEELVLAVEG